VLGISCLKCLLPVQPKETVGAPLNDRLDVFGKQIDYFVAQSTSFVRPSDWINIQKFRGIAEDQRNLNHKTGSHYQRVLWFTPYL